MSNVKFYSFDEPFEDVVYPEGDSDAVSISKRDIDLLQPDTFVNDTIIDFYIKWVFIWYIFDTFISIFAFDLSFSVILMFRMNWMFQQHC